MAAAYTIAEQKDATVYITNRGRSTTRLDVGI
ncbi:hypothetical protein SAMN05444682_104214 [Parapedobacter indicus]|uniref:Uncharacterized protein n=1 Tax=Parapedobacter indicus TaxID=1477437 RepID=A0A1I3ITY0_9SPHI|nr:hypothetical protein CLV26_104214 [Parapedobacter indicus]SFI51386.1 hypothetical protein SAMN05444682_104214 [Parapedobacter indicus]